MSNVRLVWVTENAESHIAYIARVSSENQENPDYKKLIKYLIRNRHWSPFEHACCSVEIKTSRDISAQIIRHRSFSFQEFSTRYSSVTSIEPTEIRRQGKTNRQSSEEVFDPVTACDVSASELIKFITEDDLDTYNKLLELGVARECARRILPLAASTKIYMTGNLRSFIHYIQLRNDGHTQKEHRLIAQEIEKILRPLFPITFEALDEIKREEEIKNLLYKMIVNEYRPNINADDNDRYNNEFLRKLLNVTGIALFELEKDE